jgi:hypothetical protein
MCAGARYGFYVRYRVRPGQEACVGRAGIEGVMDMQTGLDMVGDYDYVGFEFETPSSLPATSTVFVEWTCSGGAQGVLDVDNFELYIE